MSIPIGAAMAYAKQAALEKPDALLGSLEGQQAGTSFAQALEGAVSKIESLGQSTEGSVKKFTEGQSDLLSVVTAVNETEIAMETLVSVRDRMVSAYQEIIRMPI